MTVARSPEESVRTYRCPVCSHSDDVSLGGAEVVTIRCSHCDTALDVRPKGATSSAVTVAGSGGKRAPEPAS
jgi:transcription elongation factor Elf1